MAVSRETLQRIKAAVELEREAPETAAKPVEPDIKKAIERLKDDAPVAAKVPQGKPLDFSRVTFPIVGIFGTLGGFYNGFGGVMRKITESFSKLPMASTLSSTMAAAGIGMAPETFIAGCVTAGFLAGATIFLLVAVIGSVTGDALLAIAAPVLGMAAFVGVMIMALMYPASKAGGRAAQVDRSLPFALRQLATQVKAGVSFHKAIQSISTSNYGILSDEFSKVVADVNRGDTMENALVKLSRRNTSKGLRRTVTQVLRSFKTGGNLSTIISDIAEDVSFEARMNIRDFTEKLNFINVIYIMIGVVAPVTLAILSAILQIPLFAGGIPPTMIYFAFVGILGMMIAVLYVTKSMEPAAW